MPLHLDYRPSSLDEVMGNKAVVDSLKSLLSRDDDSIPHSYLFFGNSGCGKTTLARIMARELGCHEDDIMEVDSADFRGIDTIRGIRQSMMYAPSRGKARAWILDEFHMGTTEAQNAMLKALEDTPSHVYFFICTTHPQKLLVALRNRCTAFEVKPLTATMMKKLLESVIQKEGLDVPDDVVDMILEEAQGSPRTALVTLDKLKGIERGSMLRVAQQSVSEQTQAIDLCRALLKPHVSWKDVSTILSGLDVEPESVRRLVLGYCQSILLKTSNDKVYEVMECFRDNFYDIGKPGLIMACYRVFMGNK